MVREQANAKINLFLDVTDKREDGFHNIKSVMHSVTLFDVVSVSVSDSDIRRITVHTDCQELPLGEDNLVYRSAEKYLLKFNKNAAVDIKLEKNIPIGAGLAGGSSDAAAVLRACNRLYGHPLSRDELISLASELGSDVAFCLQGGTALCRGRGEIMTPICIKPNIAFVVANAPKEHVSTPSAFGLLDRAYADFDGSILPSRPATPSEMVDALNEGDLSKIASLMHNDFESVILPGCPGAAALREAMLAHGALAAMMSGSGPSVFGIFPDYATSLRAAAALGRGAHAVLSAPWFSLDGRKNSHLERNEQ